MLMGVPGSSPITDPRLRPKRTRSKGPFLRQHYPASTVVWPSPTPVRPAACASWGAASPSRDGSPPMTRITLPTCRAPYPGGSRRVPVSIASPLTRPSPFPRRVGIRIFTFEMLWGGRWRDVTIVAGSNAMERPMAQQLDDLSRSLTPLEQDSTIIAVIEMSQASWLVAGIVPGIERHLLKKLEPSEVDLLRLLMRWRAEATQKGRTITRIVVAFEGAATGSGWRAGSGPAISKPTSSTRPAWLSHASIAGRKQIASTRDCSNGSCAARLAAIPAGESPANRGVQRLP